MAAKKKMLKVRQTRSQARRSKDQEATLIGLGLGRIGKQRELEDTPSVRGMIAKVQHMVEVVSD
jgi:large subunit ribosomal protein L30